ncbi:MAG TPA: hypothetical protein VHW01_10510, partial [Polyangiaceae bacterium]|nr:hypothetical protein [Polyangiaceae bacterium]
MSEEVRDVARQQDPTMPCGEDEVREYSCDDLLPLTSSRPAPEPYDNCPGTVDVRASLYEPLGHIAGFDRGFTEYTRKQLQLRVGPGSSATAGHSCCYSWCAKVVIADPSKATLTQCRDSYGMRESFCMRELEGGSSEPASVPYNRCPVALRPPESAAFSAPQSALLDLSDTAKKRQETTLP